MPDKEELKQVEEYRIVGEKHGGERWEGPARRSGLEATVNSARELAKRNAVVRIQRRVVTETPWEDVPSE